MQYIQCTDLFYNLNTVKLKMIGIGVGNLVTLARILLN